MASPDCATASASATSPRPNRWVTISPNGYRPRFAASIRIDGSYDDAFSPPMPSTVTLLVQIAELGFTGTGPMSTNVPASITTPPVRTSASASVKVSGNPLQSITMSAPRPRVAADTAAARSGPSVAVTSRTRSAPNVPAISSRPRSRSVAMIVLAPDSRALITWQSPSGPTPSTATVYPDGLAPCRPSRVIAVSTPCVTAITSVSTATSSGSSSGTRNSRLRGSRYRYSAQPPSRYGGWAQFRLFP